MRVLFASALVANSLAQVARPGPCPAVPDQPDFDVTKYLGVWFTYLTNDFINVPSNSECVAATYGPKGDFAITVNNTEVLNVEVRGETYPVPSYAFGQAEVTDPDYPTRLLVTFEEFGGCGAQANLCGSVNPGEINLADTTAEFDQEGDSARFNYRVMETDYDNYTVVNSCVGTRNNHIEWVYLMTRDREWPDKNPEKVQELLYKINSEWGLDIDSLALSPQKDCERFMDFIP